MQCEEAFFKGFIILEKYEGKGRIAGLCVIYGFHLMSGFG
jgi:hypothetical protein